MISTLWLDGPAELVGETSSSDFTHSVIICLRLYVFEALDCPFLLLRWRLTDEDGLKCSLLLCHTGSISLSLSRGTGHPSTGTGRLSDGHSSSNSKDGRSMLHVALFSGSGETAKPVAVLSVLSVD